MFGLFSKKRKISAKELGLGLFMFHKRMSDFFIKNYKDYKEKLGVELFSRSFDYENIDRYELEIANLWIISKTLKNETKALEWMTEFYLMNIKNLSKNKYSEVEVDDFIEIVKKDIHERYAEYNKSWNDDMGTYQKLFNLKMLSFLLNGGVVNDNLFNSLIDNYVKIYIDGQIKGILNYRNNFEIT